MTRCRIELAEGAVDSVAALAFARGPDCGAAVLFEGTVRRWTRGLETTRLEYECYRSMAERELNLVASEAGASFGLESVAICHRLGSVPVGEVSMAVAAGAAHRRAALDAVAWIVDEIKRRVPIWKRDFRADGTAVWVASIRSIVAAGPGPAAGGHGDREFA